VTAGLFSRFLIAPFDVVKIRLQLQSHGTGSLKGAVVEGPTYNGILGTARTIVLQEGVTGLWKGNVPAEVLYMTYSLTQFLSYQRLHRLMANTPLESSDSLKAITAGAMAGGIATAVTYPWDLLRTRFAAQGREKIYPSLYSSVRHIYAHEGYHGFFRGLGTALMQIIPNAGIFFLTYEVARKYAVNTHHMADGWSDGISGALAATVAKTSVFPFDLIRKRLQVQGPTRLMYVHRNIPVYVGVLRTAKDIVKAEGPRGLYKGLVVSLFKSAPASAFTMWTFESMLRMMKLVDPQDDEEMKAP